MKKVALVILSIITVLIQPVSAQLPGVIAYYSFEGNADDQSGNGFDAELVGNAVANGFLKLDNTTSSYLLLPPAVMDGMTDFSITFRIQFRRFHKSGNFPTNHILTGSSSSLDRIGLSYERINLTWRLALNGTTYSFSDLLTANTWYCVVVTRSGNQAKLYVDGELVSGTTVNTSPIPCTSLLIGQEEDCSGGCFAQNQCTNGKVDELAFYDHAISPDDVVSICNTAFEKLYPDDQSQKLQDIYPNPAIDFISIPLETANVQFVEIYNLMGELVIREIYTRTIDVKDLSSGMYLICLKRTDGKLVKSGKFIKE
ncbi:MAG: T9SS type A sorting domain-containing protein [Chitinophagales bacterium]|nr:T9SS type A sorting domain-containing protein [Chitinophagales bacterium]